MIVKVQQSITTTEKRQQCLIYSENHEYFWMGDLSKELKKMLKGEWKKYFHAMVDDKGRLAIGAEAKVAPEAW